MALGASKSLLGLLSDGISLTACIVKSHILTLRDSSRRAFILFNLYQTGSCVPFWEGHIPQVTAGAALSTLLFTNSDLFQNTPKVSCFPKLAHGISACNVLVTKAQCSKDLSDQPPCPAEQTHPKCSLC